MKKDFKLLAQKIAYPYMEVPKREGVIPERGYCSIYPSSTYMDGLVVAGSGNRVYVYGDPYGERMLFEQEEMLYVKTHFPTEPPRLAGVLPQIRRLLREGRTEEADRLAMETAEQFNPLYQTDKPPVRNYAHHAVCMMLFETPKQADTYDYLRIMDYDSGQGSICWKNAKGSYERHSIASIRGDLFAHKLVTTAGEPADYKIVISGSATDTSKDVWEVRDTAAGVTRHPGRLPQLLYIGCKYDPEYMGQEGYAVFTKITASEGIVKETESGFAVSGATVIEVFNKVIHYDSFSQEKLRQDAVEFQKGVVTYDDLLQENRENIMPMMLRSRLELMPEEERLLSSEELLQRQHSSDISLGLLQRLYDTGRYFFITDTGKYPSSRGQYNINVNLQICSGNPTGLFEKMKVFFDFIESKLPDFRKNAEYILGCRGILASVHPDKKTGLSTHFGHDYPHQFWIAGTAWIYNEFWNHYLVTGDEAFLRERVFPGLLELAQFYEDFLQDKDGQGRYLLYPCFSAEDSPKGQSPVSVNSVIDIMCCRETLDNLLRACEILDMHPETEEKWKEMLQHLPDYLLDDEGGLKEWAWAGTREDFNHRHVSHHYDVWPGHAITWEDTPELARAVQISNRKRGQQNDSAHGIMHRLFTAIRLKDTDDAWMNLKQVLDHGFVRYNLWGNHFPHHVFYSDTTGSLPAVIAEMLVFSNEGVVEFLPALPSCLPHGSLKGLWTFAAAKLEQLDWNLADGTLRAEITSLKEQELVLRVRGGCRRMSVKDKNAEGAEMVGMDKISENGEAMVLFLKKGECVIVQAEL